MSSITPPNGNAINIVALGTALSAALVVLYVLCAFHSAA